MSLNAGHVVREPSDGTGNVETHLQGEVEVRLSRHKKRRNVVQAILLLFTKRLIRSRCHAQEDALNLAYPEIADVRERVGVARVMHVHDHVREVSLLRIPQCLCLVLRTELLQLKRAMHNESTNERRIDAETEVHVYIPRRISPIRQDQLS